MATLHSAFTELVTTQPLSLVMVCLVLTVTVGLGALQALSQVMAKPWLPPIWSALVVRPDTRCAWG